MTPKQLLAIFLATYVIVHADGADRYQVYESKSPADVLAMFSSEGTTVDFISQKEYDDFQQSNSPAVRKQYIADANNLSKTTDERLNALLKALGF